LVLEQEPNISVIFNNTGVEHPETVRFVRDLAERWKLNLIEIRPEVSFWEIVEKHGFPSTSRYSENGSRKRRGNQNAVVI